MKLDEYDLKILDVLQKNSKLSQQALAEAVHLSPSAVNRRIAALEKHGVIEGYHAQINAKKIGRTLTVITEVQLESERAAELDAAKARFAACAQVQQVYYVTGDADFIVIFCVRDMQEYEALTRKLFFADGNVKSFRTMVVMDAVKQDMRVDVLNS